MYKGVKYFSRAEMRCKCGCNVGDELMDDDLLYLLDDLRFSCGFALIVSSGFRCKFHNANVGGVKSSSHVKGLAVDLRVSSDFERFIIIKHALAIGFSRIGIGSGFIHLDVDGDKVGERIWVY